MPIDRVAVLARLRQHEGLVITAHSLSRCAELQWQCLNQMLDDDATQLSELHVQQRIEAMVEMVCDSYRVATTAHAPNLSAIEVENLVQQLRNVLQEFAQDTHMVNGYAHQSREQLVVLLAEAQHFEFECANSSEHLQMPIAELAVALSSQQVPHRVGQDLTFGRDNRHRLR